MFVHHRTVDYFTDDDGHLFEDDINAIAEAGITRGCNPPVNDRYCPDESFLRGQAAAFLRRALDVPASDTDHFTDDDDSVFEEDINAIATEGITLGCNPPENTLFCPDEPFTRGQAAAFVRRALEIPATNADYFSDDNDSVFEGDINAIAEAGVTPWVQPARQRPLLPRRATHSRPGGSLHETCVAALVARRPNDDGVSPALDAPGGVEVLNATPLAATAPFFLPDDADGSETRAP